MAGSIFAPATACSDASWMSEIHFDPVLEELTERSVCRLLSAEVFDEDAFDALEDHIWRKADGLQSEPVIAKQILQSLRSAVSAIRSRAEYLPEVRAQLNRADEFDTMLDRLIAGERRSDRYGACCEKLSPF